MTRSLCHSREVIPSTIDTERAVLRPLRVSDADEMVPVLADASLYEFTGGESPTLDSLIERYRHQTAGSGDPSEVWLNWVVRTKGEGRAVGFVQASVSGRSADVAWVVGVRDQGRGLATEAAAAMCEWLGRRGVERIEAHIHPLHRASQTVAERLGLVRSGGVDDDGEEIWVATRSSSPTS